MPSPIEDLLANINTVTPVYRPLVRYGASKAASGSPLSDLQLRTGLQSIVSHKPVFRTNSDHGILDDILNIPGNFVRDATETTMGLFSPWKWIPSIWHNVETGNIPGLLPLIPGYTTVKDVLGGNFHDILTHPAGTALDVLPYAKPGLKALASVKYAEAPTLEAGRISSLVPEGLPKEVAKVLDFQNTSKADRVRMAMEAGKPGKLIFNMLPDVISSPESGIVGKRLADIATKSLTGRSMATGDRGFRATIATDYIEPLMETFKDFDTAERKGFAEWWTNYNEKTPGTWKDAAGNVHDVPLKLQEAFPKAQEILKTLEVHANENLTTIWHDGRKYLYHPDSPVVKQQAVIAALDKGLGDARVATDVAKQQWVDDLHTQVNPKNPTESGPLSKPIAKKDYKLFKLKDQIEKHTARLEDLFDAKAANRRALRFANKSSLNEATGVVLDQKIKNTSAKLEQLQATHDLLSKRELLVRNIGKPANSAFHVSPEEYHLLELKSAGTVKSTANYLKKLRKLDQAKIDISSARELYTKTLAKNAPATFYPHIQDAVIQKIIEKFKESHPDFMDGISTHDFELTKQALDQKIFGKSPVEAKILTRVELNKMVREVESTWQELAAEGLHPQYLSTVPSDRFSMVLDPQLFKAGAVKDTPYAIQARTHDLTPSGIKDPVVGLTAPALAIVRRNALREFYTSFLAPFVKSESELSSWLDNEILSADSKPLGVGESHAIRRKAAIKDRWVLFDKKNVDISPELSELFPDGEKIYIPKEIYNTVVQQFKPKSTLTSLSSVNNHGMKVFRTAVMGLSAKHIAHVFFGGMAMLLLRGGMEEISPARMIEAWKMAKDHMPKELSAGVDFYSHKELTTHILPPSDPSNLGKVANAGTRVLAKVQSIEERIANFERSLSYLSELDRISSGKYTPHLTNIENAEVKAALDAGKHDHAMDLAKRGAIKHANKALIDFDGMLPAERGIIRDIFPFYTFTRHIFKYALTYPMDYPLRATFVYRLGEIVQKEMQDSNLPEDWMRYLTFGPTSPEGDQSYLDLRFLNPFRSLPGNAQGKDIASSLNPFLGYALEWAGVNPWTTSAERFPDLTYDSKSGRVETKRMPFSLLGLVSQILPQAGVLDQSSSKSTVDQVGRYGFIPGLPHHGNFNLQRVTDTLGQFEVAQGVVNNALKSGDTSGLREWNLVPVPGQSQLIPGKLLARLIESLPKSNLSPKQQLGLR